MSARPYDQAIGECVKAARENAGMRQDELAQRLTVDYELPWRQSTVAKVEAGQRTLTAIEVWAIARSIPDTDLDELLKDARLQRARRNARVEAGTVHLAHAGTREKQDVWSRSADTTANAARALGWTLDEVEDLAEELWSCSYYAERSYRIAKLTKLADKPDPRNERAVRRRVGQGMIAELRAARAEDQR
jgi:transcriptional regulator with XRE-family HTH domain